METLPGDGQIAGIEDPLPKWKFMSRNAQNRGIIHIWVGTTTYLLCVFQEQGRKTMKKLVPLVLVPVLLLVATSVASAGLRSEVALGDGPHRASGSGHFIGGAQRTFSFAAIETGPDFAAKGEGQLVVHEPGVRVHFAIDCLRVEDNIAYVSGYVKHANIFGPGWPIWFSVVDNGEGTDAAPDQSTYLYGWDPNDPNPPSHGPLVDCREGVPEDPLGVGPFDIGGGNIQVR
jgi:hypothetical protein